MKGQFLKINESPLYSTRNPRNLNISETIFVNFIWIFVNFIRTRLICGSQNCPFLCVLQFCSVELESRPIIRQWIIQEVRKDIKSDTFHCRFVLYHEEPFLVHCVQSSHILTTMILSFFGQKVHSVSFRTWDRLLIIVIIKMIVRNYEHIGCPRLTMHEMFIMHYNDFRKTANYSCLFVSGATAPSGSGPPHSRGF